LWKIGKTGTDPFNDIFLNVVYTKNHVKNFFATTYFILFEIIRLVQ